MNCTLVEIAQAMMHGLPGFLWEYAINHASYLCNHVSTKSIKGQMPYEKWFTKKPNISHLREFGAPVWVLLQGQKYLEKWRPNQDDIPLLVMMMAQSPSNIIMWKHTEFSPHEIYVS